jgi:hypothetical protein
MKRAVLGFVHRFAYATVCAFLGFVPCILPYRDRPSPVFAAICYTFNLPVAVVTWLGIPYLAGLDAWRGRGVGESMSAGEMLVWHVRVAVPTYVVLFYVPTLALWVARRQHNRQAAK